MFDISSYRVVMPSELPKPAAVVRIPEESTSALRSSQVQPQVSRLTSSALSVSSSPRVIQSSTRGSQRQFFPERRQESHASFSSSPSDSGLDSSAQNHVFLRQPVPSTSSLPSLPQTQPDIRTQLQTQQPQLFSVPPDPRFRISQALSAAAGASQGSSSPQPIITDPRLLSSSSQGLIRQDINGPNFSHQLVTLPRTPAPSPSPIAPQPEAGTRFAVADQTFIPGPPPFTDTTGTPSRQLSPPTTAALHHPSQGTQRFASASAQSSAFSHQPPSSSQPQTSLTPAQIAALNFFNGSPNPQAFQHLKERAEQQERTRHLEAEQRQRARQLQLEAENRARSQAESEARAQAEANARARAQQEAQIRAAQEAALLRQQQEASLRAQQESQARANAEAAMRAQREAQMAREAALRAQEQADAAAARYRALQEQQARLQSSPQSSPPSNSPSNPLFQRLPDVTPSSQSFQSPPQTQANTNNLPLDPFTSNLDFMRTSDRRNRVQSTSGHFSSQPQPQQTLRTTRPTSAPTATPAPSTSSGNFRQANLQIQQLPPDTDNDGIPGAAGRDYPTLVTIPETSFSCSRQPLTGYYADTETACQVVHFCQAGGTQDSFLCPNGTIFNQEKFSCQWWYEVNCANAPKFYILNDNLYRVPASSSSTSSNNNANNSASSSASSSSASVSSSSSASSSSSSSKK